jgi:predicted GIY-YIG superfamily endonuclease
LDKKLTDPAQENANASASESNEVAPEWLVYAISAEDEPEDPFYVGITINMRQRVAAHNRSRDSAAYARSKAYGATGKDCSIEVLARYPSKAEARAYETTMIALHPRLLNRDVAACTRALLRTFSDG